MPVRIPSQLYGGGAFKVDSTAATDFYLKQKAKDDAKAQTLDKYFTTLPEGANSKGVRNKDLELFHASLQDFQNYSNQHKRELANPAKYPEVYKEWERKRALPVEIADASRGAFQVSEAAGKIYADPKKGAEAFTEETLGFDKEGKPLVDANGRFTGLIGHEQPVAIRDANGNIIKNPNFVPLDIGKLQYNPEKYDAKSFNELTLMAAKGVLPDVPKRGPSIPDPKNPNRFFEQTIEEFSDEALASIGENARNFIKIDPRLKYTWTKMQPYEKWIADPKNAQEFEKLKGLYQRVYKQDINDQDDLYTAFVMDANNKPKIKTASYSKPAPKPKSTGRGGGRKTAPTYMSVGNVFDSIPDDNGFTANTKTSGGKILDASGNPYNSTSGFDLEVEVDKMPIDLWSVINEGLPDVNVTQIDEVKLNVKNGVIEGMSIPPYGTITRSQIKKYQDQKARKEKRSVPFGGSSGTTTPSTPSKSGSKFPGLKRS
jgi:hypothetical protein